MSDILNKYKNDGYVIINCHQESIIESIEKKFEKLIQSGDYNTNAKIYSYNDKPRIVDAYKKIDEIVSFSKNKILSDFLKNFYGSKPLPFSNILFKFGSEQPLHSDYIHHGTYPELLLCGTWTAMEDIQKDSGELMVVPKSHKFDIFRYSKFGCKKPKSLDEIKKNYSIYEDWVKDLINKNNLEVKKMNAVTTWYFKADQKVNSIVRSKPLLFVDGKKSGPLTNAVVLTNAAPSYAPTGQVLVAASAISPNENAELIEVKKHLAVLFGVLTDDWELIKKYEIKEALPAMNPPYSLINSNQISNDLFVAGDHRATSSIQGALISGTNAATLVKVSLGL